MGCKLEFEAQDENKLNAHSGQYKASESVIQKEFSALSQGWVYGHVFPVWCEKSGQKQLLLRDTSTSPGPKRLLSFLKTEKYPPGTVYSSFKWGCCDEWLHRNGWEKNDVMKEAALGMFRLTGRPCSPGCGTLLRS